MGRSVSGKYQTSSMGTRQWHLLDFLLDALRETGAIAFLHSGLYEASDKNFKNVYRKSSKRRVSEMEEAISRHSQTLAEQQMSEYKTLTLESINDFKLFAVKNDCVMIVASGPSTNLEQLVSWLPTFHTSGKVSHVPELFKTSTIAIGRSHREEGTRALCTLLRKKLYGER